MFCLLRRDREAQSVPDVFRLVRLQDDAEFHVDSGKILLALIELLLVDLSLGVAFFQNIER